MKTSGEEAFDARVDQTSEVTRALDEQMIEMVAASPAGLIAQVELLVGTGERELAARVGEPVDDELADQLLASITAGIKALAAPPSAFRPRHGEDAGGVDPIFAAIEAHRALVKGAR
jgi:hypothetical protein